MYNIYTMIQIFMHKQYVPYQDIMRNNMTLLSNNCPYHYINSMTKDIPKVRFSSYTETGYIKILHTIL